MNEDEIPREEGEGERGRGGEGEKNETVTGRGGETVKEEMAKEEVAKESAVKEEAVKEEVAKEVVVTTIASPFGRARTTGRIRTLSDDEFERETRTRSRRAFLVGGATMLAGFGGWRWLVTRQEEDGVLWPFRRVLETNERLARDYFADTHLTKTYPRSMAVMPRVNGVIGMDDPLDLAKWRLQVSGLAAAPAGMPKETTSADRIADPTSTYLTMDDIMALPRTEMVTELRCIEGWSVIVQWAGVKFADFVAHYGPKGRGTASLDRPPDPRPYVSLETPDGGYYVGLDIASAMHPQTLLCYEMNGRPLTPEHGAPLRLVVPAKYGVKNIKRIGTIRFTDKRPADYWAEQGYDWYAGL